MRAPASSVFCMASCTTPSIAPSRAPSIEVRAAHSDLTFSAISDQSGEFTLPAIPLGDYIVAISKPGFATLHETITVSSDSSLVLHYMLSVASVSQTVDVSGAQDAANVDSVTPTAQINRIDIARTPGADRTNSLAMITDFVPGAYMTHDMLHMRGGHQVRWLIDGVQIPNTNIASNIAPQIDPKDIDTSRSTAAATTPRSATAPTASSTSFRAPASSAIARPSSSSPPATSTRPTTSSTSATTPSASPGTPA